MRLKAATDIVGVPLPVFDENQVVCDRPSPLVVQAKDARGIGLVRMLDGPRLRSTGPVRDNGLVGGIITRG